MDKILLYGDSNTWGYDPADPFTSRYPADARWADLLAEALAGQWEVINEGLNGRKLPERAYDRERVLTLSSRLAPTDVFSVMLGTNDILHSENPDAREPVEKLEALLKLLTARRDADRILVIAPPYIGNPISQELLYRRFYEESQRMNRGFALHCRDYGVHFCDAGEWEIELAFDFVHFSAEGHRRFAKKIEKVVKSIPPGGLCGLS